MAISELPGRGVDFAKKKIRVTTVPVIIGIASIMSSCGDDGVTNSTNFPDCGDDPLTKVQEMQVGIVNGKDTSANVDDVVFESPQNVQPARLDIKSTPRGRVTAAQGGTLPVSFSGKNDQRGYQVGAVSLFTSGDSQDSGITIRVTAQCSQ